MAVEAQQAGWYRTEIYKEKNTWTEIITLLWYSGALGVNRFISTQLKKLQGCCGYEAYSGCWQCVYFRYFHQNMKAKQVVPQRSSGFLDGALNGSVMAPDITSRNTVI